MKVQESPDALETGCHIETNDHNAVYDVYVDNVVVENRNAVDMGDAVSATDVNKTGNSTDDDDNDVPLIQFCTSKNKN